MRGLVVAVGLSLLLCACGPFGDDSRLKDASASCAKSLEDEMTGGARFFVRGEDYLDLGDDGKSLTLASAVESKPAATATVLLMTCLLDQLDAPDSVTSEVGQTTAMMGRQSTDWDDFEVDYSYHPDSGVSAVFKLK